MFVNQNEIAETLADRGVFMIRPTILFNMLKKFKKLGVYQQYMMWDMKNFKAKYERPEKYIDFNNAFNSVRKVDEAQGSIKPDFFADIKGSIHLYSADYLAIHARSFLKPIFELWDVAMNCEMFTGILNPEENMDLFTVDSVTRIFNRFELPV